MKKYASFGLYVFSIVLAVGIGMGQVGKTYQPNMEGASIKCPITTIGDANCGQVSGEPTCGYSYATGKEFAGVESNYKSIATSQCGTYNSSGEFTRYSGCQSVSTKPTSDGCGD
jgi:hypothetical protein